MLERGENGLLLSWEGLSVFVNFPFSNPLPFAKKLIEAKSFCVLCNEDSSTEWWRQITQWPCYQFSFFDRVEFPHEVLDTSKNNSSQVMVCDPTFFPYIYEPFKPYGQWWKKL